MNRFLTNAMAMALGLALCGIAKADGRTDHEGFERDRHADCDRDGLRHIDLWRLPFYWDGMRYFDHRWYDPDLRHFDDYWRVNHYCFCHGHPCWRGNQVILRRSST